MLRMKYIVLEFLTYLKLFKNTTGMNCLKSAVFYIVMLNSSSTLVL